jgi:PEP-CTERM motif
VSIRARWLVFMAVVTVCIAASSAAAQGGGAFSNQIFNGRFLFGGPNDAGAIPSTSSYTWYINNAIGTAGLVPNAQNQLSGWAIVQIRSATTNPFQNGQFYWDATPTDKLTFSLDTLINPTTVGNDVQGPMANFDPTRSYTWIIVQFAGSYLTQNTAAYAGGPPTASATLDASTDFDFTNFSNTGTTPSEFGWQLVLNSPANTGGFLNLVYAPTPVPEPGTLALTALGVMGFVAGRWRWRRSFTALNSAKEPRTK